MSEPITRADLLVLFQYLKDGAFSRELTLLGMVVCNYLEPHDRPKAESASPPRVPGPSAQFAKVGVQSGPGQPIDICERLDNLAQQGHRIGYPTCDDIAEAAAEIRRLRAEIAAMDSLLTRTFDDLGVLREQVKTERRAGVEAAAQYCIEGDVLLPGQAKAMVRALADKPALSDKGG